MPRDLATLAGYGLDYALIVQGIDQLKDLYGQGAGTILSNCAYKWFCNVNDLESAKYLSETLGKKTVRTVGRTENDQGGGFSFGETGRPLLTPDEILNLGRDAAIVTHPGGDPYYLRPIDYWNLQAMFSQLREKYPESYWEPPLAYDPNPYYRQKQAGGQQRQQDSGQKQEQQQRQERTAQPPRSGQMSRVEALAILGLAEGATTQEIRAAWKRLIQKLHPDTGGSTRLAQMLTEARDVLLSGQAAK